MRAIRTAVTRGLRPLALIEQRRPHGKWTRDDYLLLEAFQIYEDEVSGEHGLPLWISRSISPDIAFAVETREDRAAAQMHAWREKNKDADKKGLRPVIFPVDLEGNRMEYGGLTRQQFGEAASQEEQDELEGIDVERERPPGGYNPSEYGDG